MTKKHLSLPLPLALILFLLASCAKPDIEKVDPVDIYTDDSTNDHWMKGQQWGAQDTAMSNGTTINY